MSQYCEIPYTLEDLGKTGTSLEIIICGTAYEGEPMVRYYPDGSGYPGSPPTFEVDHVIVEEAWGEDWVAVRFDFPEWFEWLDAVALQIILDRNLENELLEEL